MLTPVRWRAVVAALLLAVYMVAGVFHQVVGETDSWPGSQDAAFTSGSPATGGALGKSLVSIVRHCPGCFSQFPSDSSRIVHGVARATTMVAPAATHGLEDALANVEPRPPKAVV